jgi:hypothetical protein
MKKEDIKPFAWGMGVGAIVLLIVIFSTGWVVKSSTAESQARAMATEAVMNVLAPIAVAQFMQDPNRVARLAELKKLETWGENNRTDYVIKQGWATMPGDKEPNGRLADEVAKRLGELKL